MAEYLVQQGHQVICMVRKTSDLSNLEGLNVEYFYGDLTDAESLSIGLKGVDYIFHFAGKVKAKNEAEFMKVNAFGVGILAEACLKQPDIKMLVHCSSLAAVGPQTSREPINETFSPNPVSLYGRSKLEGELILQKILHNHKVPWCIVRPSGVYGPKDTEVFIYFKFVNRGWKITVSGAERKVGMIHGRDLARFCWLAATRSKSGEIYLASDGASYTWLELSDYIAKALNRRTKHLKVPLWLTGSVAIISEWLARLSGSVSIINRDKIKELREPGWVVSIEKAREILGFEPEFNAESGLKNTADWYKQNGWL